MDSSVKRGCGPTKPKCFLLFVDLDDTYTPMDIPGMIDFIQVVREIREKTGAAVKFCPISGRPASYVLRTLHQARDLLAGAGLHHVCEFGAAEHGAVIVDSCRSYAPVFLGCPESRSLKHRVDRIIRQSPHYRLICDEPDKLFTCSIHIRNEFKLNMAKADQIQLFSSLRHLITNELGLDSVVTLMSHDCLEVMARSTGKDVALQHLIYQHMAAFNVVGMAYAGDSENDTKAIRLVSKLAEVPGVRANVFLPSNASKLIESRFLEKWKSANPQASDCRIQVADERLFRGVTKLIRKAIREKRLVGTGVKVWRTKDDSCLPSRVLRLQPKSLPAPCQTSRIPIEFLLPHRDIREKQVRRALESLSSSVGLIINEKKLLWGQNPFVSVQAGLRLATVHI